MMIRTQWPEELSPPPIRRKTSAKMASTRRLAVESCIDNPRNPATDPLHKTYAQKVHPQLDPADEVGALANLFSARAIRGIVRTWWEIGPGTIGPAINRVPTRFGAMPGPQRVDPILFVTRVYSGSDRDGKICFGSLNTMGGTVSRLATASLYRHARLANNPDYLKAAWEDVTAHYRGEAPQEVKPLIHHMLWRWANREYDGRDVEDEQESYGNFLADLYKPWSFFDNKHLVIPEIPIGLTISHMAESCHCDEEWSALDKQVHDPSAPLGANALKEFPRYTWASGNKVELVTAETTEVNESRKFCTQFGLMWIEGSDGTRIPLDPNAPRAEVEDSALPAHHPSACWHSTFGVPCYTAQVQRSGEVPEGATPARLARAGAGAKRGAKQRKKAGTGAPGRRGAAPEPFGGPVTPGEAEEGSDVEEAPKKKRK